MADAASGPVLLARQAMATRFEIVLHGGDPVALRAAGEAALEEIERLEARLSLYQPASDIARVNARAAFEPVRVSSEVFRLLQWAARLTQEAQGAFDITVGPLVRCWGFMGGRGAWPEPAALAAARACVGMGLVELREPDFTVRFVRPGVMLDLGGIGKGYALDCAVEILREAGVTSALLHGGTSTTFALGAPPGAAAWKVGIEWDQGRGGVASLPAPAAPGSAKERPEAGPSVLAVVPLRDESVSVSAIWGRAFERDGRTWGHVLDPRTGEPVGGAQLAAVVLPAATETDALSTALLTLGRAGLATLGRGRAGLRGLVAGREAGSGACWLEATGLELAAQVPRGGGR